GLALFRSLGFVRAIVWPTCIRGSRSGSQLLHSSSDRAEWAEPMLLRGKSVRIGAVWSVDWFLEPNWKILVEIGLLRSLLTHDVAGDVIGLLVGQERRVEPGAERHIVKGIGGRGQKPTHSCAVVVAVSSPERRKLIAESLLRTLSRAVHSVACRANLRVDFGASLDISGAIRLLDLQRASPAQLRAIGNAGGKPPHIGREGF